MLTTLVTSFSVLETKQCFSSPHTLEALCYALCYARMSLRDLYRWSLPLVANQLLQNHTVMEEGGMDSQEHEDKPRLSLTMEGATRNETFQKKWTKPLMLWDVMLTKKCQIMELKSNKWADSNFSTTLGFSVDILAGLQHLYPAETEQPHWNQVLSSLKRNFEF